jgi:hypothetical protein
MTRLCSAGRHDRAIGVARILYDEVGGSPPRRDTRFVGNMGAAFSQGAFGAHGPSAPFKRFADQGPCGVAFTTHDGLRRDYCRDPLKRN